MDEHGGMTGSTGAAAAPVGQEPATGTTLPHWLRPGPPRRTAALLLLAASLLWWVVSASLSIFAVLGIENRLTTGELVGDLLSPAVLALASSLAVVALVWTGSPAGRLLGALVAGASVVIHLWRFMTGLGSFGSGTSTAVEVGGLVWSLAGLGLNLAVLALLLRPDRVHRRSGALVPR